MTVTKITIGLLLIGIAAGSSRGAGSPQADPLGQSSTDQPACASGAAPTPSYERYLREKYGLRYRIDPLDSSSRLGALRRTGRYAPGPRYVLPLNRSGVYRRWPPNYERRVTPYYDGRGYGVPSTSPFRYRPDLDGPIRPRRHY